jgi:hypothetical protein
MKWVRCSYHNLQHIASEKPRELPTATVTIYQDKAASSWPAAAVEGAETHNICMKKTCYEYEVSEVFLS